jgi:hypothetical protein
MCTNLRCFAINFSYFCLVNIVRKWTQILDTDKKDAMRKLKILGYAVLLISTGIVQAQTKMALGLALGGSYNVHTGSGLPKTATGVGFVGGVQIDVSFTKSFALLTTVYAYDNRIGSYTRDVTIDGIDFTEENTVTIAYAGIEPLLKFSMPDDRFYLLAGPSIGFKVQAQEDDTQTTTTPATGFPNGYSYQSTYEPADINTRFEFNVGGGYVFRIDAQSRLTTQLTFAYGLNKIEKNVNWSINSIRLIAGLEFDVFQ